MYKVVIVDDDRIIRRGLSSVIPWKEHGFELVGEAADGETGLELIEATNPQIVVSDIQMPFMNGLEMAKVIREKKPKTKIILLTGYEDFQYAHEAIKLKAFDYVLKPVENSSLIEKLKQASAEWELESQREKQIHESRLFIEQQFLKKLSLMSSSSEQLPRELDSIGIKTAGSAFAASYIKVDHFGGGSDSSRVEMKKFQVMQECKKWIHNSFIQGDIVNAESEHFAVFLSTDKMNAEDFKQEVKLLFKHFLKNVDEKLRITVTITMGRVYPDLSGLHRSYLEALTAMGFRHIIGKNTVYSITETESVQFTETASDFHFYEALIQFIKLGLPEKVTALLDDIKTDLLKTKSLSLQNVVLLANRIINLISYESEKGVKTWDRLKFRDYESEIMQMQTIDDIFEKVKEVAADAALCVHQLNSNQRHSLVDKAIAFIQSNYQVGNLSLQMVADEIHISSAYLSNLFKVEKGFNFGDFLLETRMKKAMELFRQTNLKSYEIAEKTGYSNPQYFSSSFKKYTGYSPAEFRKLK